ncbi:MAG: aminotransferase class III-fold pyridoxal phosphate-dependent enzyme [Candidatus Omnitrophica bacterium]|nr:aminotransferase class III-fold pyridoxal phosphate-dependent enzyme [Candidatus Omnitrophota bacterium]
MGKSFPLIPKQVPRVETKYRRIVTPIPVPESLPLLEKLRQFEPRSMSGQPPVIWDRATGVNVFDRYGNKWLDFSSGVLVTNAGHGHPLVVEKLREQIEKPLLHHYCFPAEPRALLVEKLASLSPEPLKKVFLLTTGAETIECALKLCRTWGKPQGKTVFISFEGAFHGRTLGAQMAGGIPALKDWIAYHDPEIIQVPFPGDPRCQDRSFSLFEKTLKGKGIKPERVCGVLSETYQGATAAFLPEEYAKALRDWCNHHQALLVFDEVQAGFGRTGKLFGFQHYSILPDLFCLGKGISSSLPLAAVIGRPEIMDLYEPGTMTSTHSGSPLCCAAALGSIEAIERENLVLQAAQRGQVFQEKLRALVTRFSGRLLLCGRGLVWGLMFVHPGSLEPDGETAFEVVARCMEKGLLFFAPVGPGGATIKISPPLSIPEEAVREGCSVLEDVLAEVYS